MGERKMIKKVIIWGMFESLNGDNQDYDHEKKFRNMVD